MEGNGLTSKTDHSLRTDVRPFLRWAGGKSRIISVLEERLPSGFSNGNRYYEPFLGAGSLFFRIKPSRATLSDNNKDLIECYKAIRKRPELISRYLKRHLINNDQDYYYRMREKYNKSGSSIAKAALFIYLNKTCFNGIWRVNSRGEFNVPYGHRNPQAPQLIREVMKASKALSGATLVHRDYRQVIRYAREDDLVYFDPPYPPLNGTSYFTHYTREGFGPKHHIELASVMNILDKKGCHVMVSNADTPFIRGLYEEFNIHELEVMRWIRSDGNRYLAQEVIITNY